MGLYNRTKTVIESKVNKFLEKLEKPTETLDLAYEKQLEMLQNVKRGITEIATAKTRLEMQKQKLLRDSIDIDEKAKESLKQGNEPMARLALERKTKIEEDVQSLIKQIKKLGADQEKLTQAEKTLEFKIEQFRTQKETMKAQYSAAEAQVKISESLTGISESGKDVGTVMRRAEEKTEAMTARASAIGELTDSGVLSNVGDDDSISRELSRVKTKGKVDDQLERMKKGILPDREITTQDRKTIQRHNDLDTLIGSHK